MEFYSVQDVEIGQFYQLPKILIHGEKYKDLSSTEKIAYAILRDRHSLSIKNGWIDENNNVYFIFTDKELAEILETTIRTANKIKNNLQKHGLLVMKRQGRNKPNILYLTKPESESNNLDRKKSSYPDEKKISYPDRKKSSYPDRKKTSSNNYTDNNYTDISNTDINHTDVNILCKETSEDENEIKKLLESREDINQKTKNEILKIYQRVKQKSNFKIEVFKETLEIIDFDIYDLNYFRKALTNNLKNGFIRGEMKCTNSLKKEPIPEWFNKPNQDSDPEELKKIEKALIKEIDESNDEEWKKVCKESLKSIQEKLKKVG